MPVAQQRGMPVGSDESTGLLVVPDVPVAQQLGMPVVYRAPDY